MDPRPIHTSHVGTERHDESSGRRNGGSSDTAKAIARPVRVRPGCGCYRTTRWTWWRLLPARAVSSVATHTQACCVFGWHQRDPNPPRNGTGTHPRGRFRHSSASHLVQRRTFHWPFASVAPFFTLSHLDSSYMPLFADVCDVVRTRRLVQRIRSIFDEKRGQNLSLGVSSLGPATCPCPRNNPRAFAWWNAQAPSSTKQRPNYLSCGYKPAWRSSCFMLQKTFRALSSSEDLHRPFDSVPGISTPFSERMDENDPWVPASSFLSR